MNNELSALEVMAGIYCSGARLCIRDDGELGLLATQGQHQHIASTGLFEAIGAHYDEIRATTFEGIQQVLDGYQPALDGLAAHEFQDWMSA